MTSSSYSTDENGVRKTMNRATTQKKSPGRSSSWHTVDYNDGTVIASVVSRGPADIVVHENKAYVNRNLVSEDVGHLYEPTYQIGEDGSYWYTNLPIGWEMDENEKKFFKNKRRRINGQQEDYANAGQAIMKSADRTLAALQPSRSSPGGYGRNVENIWDLPRAYGNQFSKDIRNQFSGVYENQSPYSGGSFSDWDASSSGGSSPRPRGNRGRGRRDVGREEEKRRSGNNSPRERTTQSPRKYSRHGYRK
ncbi:unnamed protein product [Bemisia tabaci]|uniref:Uncharacterized protein n=1 Tax=Bemisia tabaci TaxID=7038 RepID=A0A9P0F331_BEMTA|nr:unnamed protein product [Bemisia tabaci]